ncbi:acyl-CoA synthetase [Microbulbifer variabilis]|uniref:acyl-CoA synthetase n=1 Tax=Microbulbifer variabilis TaxID=266805 RepID=UPI001CFCE667|nr:acyl-CoA synthetase [Microbulbifer variabilis]
MSTSTLKGIEALEVYLQTGKQPEGQDFSSLKAFSEKFSGNTFEALMAACKRYSRQTAISFFLSGKDYRKPVKISYQTLAERIVQTANLFNSVGIQEHDTVAFVLPNLPETHYVLWGAEAAAKVLAINPLLEGKQIEELIRHSQAKAIVTLSPFPGTDICEKVENILPNLPEVKSIFHVDPAYHTGGFKGIAASAIQYQYRRRLKSLEGKKRIPFQSAIKQQPSSHLNFKRSIQSDDTASLFCTGGTTGLPKIATHTHGNELANAKSIGLVAGDIMGPGKVILCGLPLFHVNAAIVTGLAAFINGCEVVLMTPQGYRGEGVFSNFWSIIEFYRVNSFSAVPTVYSTLLQQPVNQCDISSLQMALCGAAPMPIEVFNAFERITGVQIVEGYGLTEGTCASSLTPPRGTKKVGSIGLRLPLQEMRSVQLDERGNFIRYSQTNEIGNLLIRGDNVFDGYLNPEHNKGIWVQDDQGQRWLNTGDLGRQDEEGYFWLTGRKKELIVRGGHNIEPKLIEEVLCRHPSVAIAAAVGTPDAHAGEVPVAYVMLSGEAMSTLTVRGQEVVMDDSARALLEEITAYAKENITERAAIPRKIVLRAGLPTTAVGKIFKPALEMEEIRLCVQDIIDRLVQGTDSAITESQVKVEQDKVLGTIARVTTGGDSSLDGALAEQLAPYTFKYEIV